MKFRHLRTVALRSVALGMGVAVLRLSFLLIFVIYGRVFGVEQLGMLSLAYVVLQFASIGQDFGLNAIGARLVVKSPEYERMLVTAITMRRFAFTTFAFAVALLYAQLGPVPDEARVFISWVVLSNVLYSLSLEWWLWGTERFLLLGAWRAATGALILIVTLIGIGPLSLGRYSFPLGNLGGWLVCTLTLWLYWRAKRLQRGTGAPTDAQLRAELRLHNVLFLGLAILFNRAFQSVDTLMLGALTTLDEVGLYNAAYRLISVPLAICNVLTQAVFPRLARSGISAIPRVLRYATVLALMGALLAMGLAGFAEPVMQAAFGKELIPASGLLRVLAWAVPLEFLAGLCGTALVAWGKSRLSLLITACAAAINVLANMWAIPRYGAEGAASVTIVSYVVLASLFLSTLWRLHRGASHANQELVIHHDSA